MMPEIFSEIIGIRMHHRNILPHLLISLNLMMTVLMFSGCSEEQQNAVRQRRDNLTSLGQAYKEMHKAAGNSPKTSDALAEWMAKSADAATRGQARDCLVEGDVIVNWDGNLSVPDNLGRFVLAFEAATPARGGYVVMGDGVVKSMTAKQFAAAEMLPENRN